MIRWLSLSSLLLLLAVPATAVAQPAPAGTADKPAPPDAGAVPTPVDEPVSEAADPGDTVGQAGFMDVRLNLTFVNENVFAEPGETIPSVPGWRFGVPNSLGTLFFDNYDTRFSGYETLSHAVLYRKHDKENWEAEGALVLRLNDVAERRIDISDAGSYIRVAHWFDPTRKDPARVSLTAFPTSSDRFRLGYSYRLSWGGSDEFRRSRRSVPGVKVQYENDKVYGYIGAKSAVVLDGSTAEEVAVLSFLAGAGMDITPMVHLDVNGGYFNRGSNELQDVITEDVQLYGASVQLAVHDGMPVGSSIDYKLYRNDPIRVSRLFRRAEYPGGLSWLASTEATVMGQTLKDPETTGSTTVQVGTAGDLNVRVKNNRMRFQADFQYRDLAFILHSTPSLPTYSDFPMLYDKTANLFADVGVDQNFDDRITVGVIVGVELPATLTTPTGVIPGDTVEGSGTSTAVIRNAGDITILPVGKDVVPQFAVKLTGRLDFSEYFAALVDAYYSYDPNQTRLTRDGPEELFRREFGEFNQLGFNITLQSKF